MFDDQAKEASLELVNLIGQGQSGIHSRLAMAETGVQNSL